jgi:hypothetical protein
LLSCEPAPEPEAVTWQPVKVRNLYQIELPSTFQMGYDMHDYASLQYYDLNHSLFILGIEDAKQNLGDIKRRRLSLAGYFSFVEDNVLEATDLFRREETVICELPGTYDNEAKIRDYYVVNEDWAPIPLFYRIAVFESSEYFFQIVIWMPYQDHCDHYPTVERITYSFAMLANALGDEKPTPSLTGN